MKRLWILALLLCACARDATPARRLTLPARSTAWAIDITALGTSVDMLEQAIANTLALNPEIVRVDRAQSEGHLDLTVHTVGTPLVDANCSADARVTVRRAFGPPILDLTNDFHEPCGWNGNARDELYDQAVSWALEAALAALAQPEASGGESSR